MVGIQSKFIHTHDIVLSVVSQCSGQGTHRRSPSSSRAICSRHLGSRPGYFRLWTAEDLWGWRQTSELSVLAYSLVMYFLGQAYWLLQVPHGKRQLPQSSWLQKALGSAPKPAPGPKHWEGRRPQHSWAARAAWSRDHPSIHHCFWELWPGVANNKNTRFD